MRTLLSLVLVALIASVTGSKTSFAHEDPWACVHMQPPGIYYHFHPPFNPFIWYCVLVTPYQPVTPPPQPPREGDEGGEYYRISSFSGESGKTIYGSKCFNLEDCDDKIDRKIEQCGRVTQRGSVKRECEEHFSNEKKKASDYFM